ncbi:5-(carboxyamino)imidazole ribonucleotide synthase [Hyphomonas sp. FCG-A18]|uniref:5-(carboxyamino)imidazole ribonucleotide synthase n=1 Tax=Hyphomonas sp. FCG-A18 TaxID=3080019 RepID=UPI002B322119|nr:5-(carboxyamino)imidazole ribonucleotide synthase [Hyphomonas sp. FCG-A18]
MIAPLPVGATIGILGNGQLGRMLAEAAARLGFDVSVYGPEPDSPASRVVALEVRADYTDLDAVIAWGKACDVVTYEFENVPVATAQALIDAGVLVRPGAKPLEMAQDRVIEKTFLKQCGIPTADFAGIGAASEIETPLNQFGGKGILKTRRDGYDGKGQVRLVAGDDFEEAHHALAYAPAILEAFIPFEKEVSVLIARGADGETRVWDIPENGHVNGILRTSTVPAEVTESTSQETKRAAKALAEALDYIGVLALEFFVLENGDVVANEFAPRVHNSGHWTPEACATGQFEQHIRAVAGWPLGLVTRYHDVVMENLLGDEILSTDQRLAAGEIVTLYGKREAKPGRKMGHSVRRLT